MANDKLLILQFKRGSADALRRIYDKYEGHLLTLAAGLLINIGDAEDAVHDMFVSFAQSAEKLKVNGSLKSYLATCVVNRARDMMRKVRSRKSVGLDDVGDPVGGDMDRPDVSVMCNEESRRLHNAMAKLPYEQREVIMLHVYEEMTFRQIAGLQGAPINTVQGRYRYGLKKLRETLASEVQDELI